MRILILGRDAFGAIATACILAACSSTPSSALGPLGQTSDADITAGASTTLAAAVRSSLQHPDHSKSWMSPKVEQTHQLLFVSDSGSDDVYIFKVPTLELEGTLTGFDTPQGECSDKHGNVWVTENGDGNIVEFSHTGTLLNTLHERAGPPLGCAIDPTSGNLAVTIISVVDGGPGEVLVYPGASGDPKVYYNRKQYRYYFDTYDSSGNLYVDGCTGHCFLLGGAFELSELPKGANRMHTVSITGGTIYYPGLVQWSAATHSLYVGDQLCGDAYAACIYLVSISGSGGTIISTTNLSNYAGAAVCDLVQGVVAPNEKDVYGGDFDHCGGRYASSENRWAFPAGGNPTNYNDTLLSPIGAAISTK
jgi:hypothetical protein